MNGERGSTKHGPKVDDDLKQNEMEPEEFEPEDIAKPFEVKPVANKRATADDVVDETAEVSGETEGDNA